MVTVYPQSSRFPTATAYHYPFSDSLVLVKMTVYPTERIRFTYPLVPYFHSLSGSG